MTYALSALMTTAALQLAAAGPADTAEAIEAAIIERLAQVKSLSAKLEIETRMETPRYKYHERARGTYEFATKNGRYLLRSETKNDTTLEVGEDVKKKSGEVLTVADGRAAHTLRVEDGKKTVLETRYENNVGLDDFRRLQSIYNLTPLPGEEIDGAAVYVLRATPNTEHGQLDGSLLLYYLKASGVLVKSSALDPAGKVLRTMRLTDVRVNAEIAPERFEFTPPKDAEIIDATDQ